MRKDPAVRAILLNWRRLTAGRSGTPERGTLVACSGGADSCALVLALSAAGRGNAGRLVVGHVVHDLRAEPEALADRDAVRELAMRLGLEFVEARVRVREGGGNLEARAREARYAALAEMALERGLGFVAVAHHADDQLETVLMSLLRGTGGVGIRGMRGKRTLQRGCDGRHAASHVRLIRPMLTGTTVIDREACRRICGLAGFEWREDATNADTTRLRAALRHRVIPVLRELRPAVTRRAIAAAEFSEQSQARLTRAARRTLRSARRPSAGELEWDRARLRGRDPILLGELLRLAHHELRGREGADRLGKRAIGAVVRAIRDDSTEPRRLALGIVSVEVTARAVRCSARPPSR
jgi:tRNA(Ile)-lysidine synthetase-like protein